MIDVTNKPAFSRRGGAQASRLAPVRAMLVAALAWFGAADAVADDRFEPVRAAIQARLTETSLPSMAVAVVEDGRIVWEEGFGWADRERRIVSSAHTPYSLASISKPITTTAVMTLVRDGKVDIEVPVDRYLEAGTLDAYLGRTEDVNLHRLMNHTAGLGTYHRTFASSPPPVGAELRRYGQVMGPPGESWNYSNIGYGVLTEVIERVSGMSFADYLRKQVFEPLGMHDSSVGVSPAQASRTAARYGDDDLPLPYYELASPGSGGVYASAHDLARFALFHMGRGLKDQKPILPGALLSRMRESGVNFRPNEFYALGWDIDHTPSGHHLVGHGGGMAGVSTSLVMVPDRGIAVVVLTNGNKGSGDIVGRIMRVLLPDYQPVRFVRPDLNARFQPPVEFIGTWKGELHTQWGELPFDLDVTPLGTIVGKVGGQMETLLANTRLEDGFMIGSMMSIFQATERDPAGARLRKLTLRMKVRDGVMSGGAFVDEGGVDGVSQWVRLVKAVP